MSATTDGTASRQVPGLGLIEYEERPYRRYWFTAEGKTRRQRQRSVTTILRESWAKPNLVAWAAREGSNMDAARDAAFARGRAAHLFIETYLTSGELMAASEFEQAYRGYISAAAAFLFEHDPQPIEVEQLVCWPERGYAGRLDLIATLAGDERRTLLDFKTSPDGVVYPEAHAQAHAYQLAYERCGGDPIERRVIVALAEGGTFELVEGVAVGGDAWQACLTFDQWRIKLEKAVSNGR